MKELSIEQKAQRYDEALKYARIYYTNGNEDMKMMIKTCFPVLVEDSEDKRIRKELKEVLDICLNARPQIIKELQYLKFINWIEKQEEQKSVNKVEPKFHEGDFILNGDFTDDGKTEIFKVLKVCDTWYDVENIYDSRHTIITFKQEYSCRVWNTIQDAKDGDVLTCENGWTCIFKTLVNDETFSSYCFMDNTKWFCETGSECHTLNKEFMKAYNGEIKPATKEQRDLLFQKMHEAGYEWDAEKKELKKIIDEEQIKKNLQDNSFRRMFEQNPAWSEQDEKIYNLLYEEYKNIAYYSHSREKAEDMPGEVLGWLKSIKGRVYPQPKQEWSEEVEAAISLLKDIAEEQEKDYCPYNANNLRKAAQYLETCRPQSQWKPSDEQMDALESAIVDSISSIQKHSLESLYNELKKLF